MDVCLGLDLDPVGAQWIQWVGGCAMNPWFSPLTGCG